MHEQSETVQTREGQWINVYGKGTARGLPGKPLEPKYFYESATYPTMEAAVAAAERRSREPETSGSEPYGVDRQAVEPAGPAQGGGVDVDEFLRDIKALSPQEQAEMKAEFLRRYIMPNKAFQQASIEGKYALMRRMGVPEDTAFPGQTYIKAAPGVGGRILGRAGGLPSGEQMSESPWLSGLGAAGTLFNLPGAALGEGVDAVTGRRPSSFPWEMASPGEATHGLANLAMMAPKGAMMGGPPIWRQLIRSPGMLRRFLNTLNERIMANYAGAMTDIPKAGRPPLMLPPPGGTTQNPFVMGGGFQKPVPPPYQRPASTMPKWSQKSLPDEIVPPGPID